MASFIALMGDEMVDTGQLLSITANAFVGSVFGSTLYLFETGDAPGLSKFVLPNSKNNHALLFDCNTLNFEQIPFDTHDYTLLIINGKKPQSLIQSAWDERKSEREEALRILIEKEKMLPHEPLVSAQMEDIDVIADPTIRRRARHVISEQLRVKHAAMALRNGDLHTFGRLMTASHRSMKEDYEITGIEMDTLAETAQNIDDCLGARMTGGGFGGFAIALVRTAKLEFFKEILSRRYTLVTGLVCEYYECEAANDVRSL